MLLMMMMMMMMVKIFFLNFILIYKLNIQIQVSLIIGNLYSDNIVTGISSIKKGMNEYNNTMMNKKKFCKKNLRLKEDC